jgi:hypothetical protein
MSKQKCIWIVSLFIVTFMSIFHIPSYESTNSCLNRLYLKAYVNIRLNPSANMNTTADWLGGNVSHVSINFRSSIIIIIIISTFSNTFWALQ